jgi:alkanesulfonate monooxygenase SsuD/methylene tetrahydromethanopterin reductase-like flavin-dependent oxidoreductase (luciferase family)
MRRAAARGDGWMPYLYSPERYARSVATVREHAETIGRDLSSFTWYAYVFVSLDDDRTRARRTAAEFLGGTYSQDFDAMIDRVACAGDVDQVVDRLTAFVDAGVDHFVLAPCGHDRHTTSLRLLDEVLPVVRKRTQDDVVG